MKTNEISSSLTTLFSELVDGANNPGGAFALSTYEANDGAPAGSYAVTVEWREPRYDAAGRPGRNQLPGRYADPRTSGLAVEIKRGTNDVALDLTRGQ